MGLFGFGRKPKTNGLDPEFFNDFRKSLPSVHAEPEKPEEEEVILCEDDPRWEELNEMIEDLYRQTRHGINDYHFSVLMVDIFNFRDEIIVDYEDDE